MNTRRSGFLLLAIAGCTASDPFDTQVGERTAAVTSTQGLDTPLLYDPQYYESLYPDLQAAFGADLDGLHQHWLTHGIYEGRRGSPVFDCALDLQLTGRTDGDCAAAMAAWQSTGLAQGQRASNEFDPVFYLANNADLQSAFGATGYVAAAQHFLTFGLWQEERAGSNEFDVSYYVCHTTDLANAFFGDPRGAAEHWATIGLPAGLRGSRQFDVQTYLARYPDLRAAFGTNYVAAMASWLVDGIHEGRTGEPYDGSASPACALGPSVPLTGSFTTSAPGFPSRWFGVPLPAGTLGYTGLNGSVTVSNSVNLYAEELFIVGYLPASAGACISGAWPATTPEFGPPGMIGLTNLIVKAPTAGTFRAPANFVLPAEPQVSGCLMIGLNGGTVLTPHSVTSTANLVFRYSTGSNGFLLGGGAEYCFGQTHGCQGATADNTKSFAVATRFPSNGSLAALFGNISDSTFDGTPAFGAPPPGAWTATNDFYVYHGAECNLPAGPGNFYAQIPSDALHVASVPASGNGIGVSTLPVFKQLMVPVTVNDCLVTLFGVNGPGGFDNETQVSAILISGPLLTASTGAIDFGTLPAGQTITASLTLNNIGGGPVTLSRMHIDNGGGQFTFASAPCTSGTECDQVQVAQDTALSLMLRCQPGGGTQTATLVLESNSLANPTQAIPLHCQGQGPRLSLSPPTSLAFGPTNLSPGWAQQSLQLSNTGNAPLTFTASQPSGPFALNCTNGCTCTDSGCSGTISAGGSLSLTVGFSPSSHGAQSSAITISSNDPVTPSVSVPETGTGVRGVLSVSPAIYDFGDVLRYTTPKLTLSLTNTGDGPLSIVGASFQYHFCQLDAQPAPQSIQPGATSTLSLHCTTSYLGHVQEILLIATDIPGGPLSGVMLNYNVLPGPVATVVQPASGVVTLPASAPNNELTLLNTGNQTLTVTGASFTGPTQAGVVFSVNGPTLPLQLAPNATAMWTFSCISLTGASGSRTFTLQHNALPDLSTGITVQCKSTGDVNPSPGPVEPPPGDPGPPPPADQ